MSDIALQIIMLARKFDDARNSAEALNAANQLIDLLRGRVKELEAQWQPIETAPKDGTEVLAYHVDGKNWHQVSWDRVHDHWKMRWNSDYRQRDGHYSHWMPLPPTPEMSE